MMAPQLSVNLTSDFLKYIKFSQNTPNGVWVDAVTFDNNGQLVGVKNIIGNYCGSSLKCTSSYCSTNNTIKQSILCLNCGSYCGAETYIVVSGGKTCATQSPVYSYNKSNCASKGPACGYISCQTFAHKNNFQYGQFEWTLNANGGCGDLTAINNFSLNMGLSAAGGKSGYNVTATDVFDAINIVKAQCSKVVYRFNGCTKSTNGIPYNPSLHKQESFAVTPTSALASAKPLWCGKTAPFAASDWCGYLTAIQPSNVYSKVELSGTFNGAAAVVPTVQCTPVPYKIYHNPGFFDYTLNYGSIQSSCGSINGQSAFVLAPTNASIIKGYIVIPQNSTGCFNGGLANSIYSTLGNAQVYAKCPINTPAACNPVYTFPTVNKCGVTVTTNYFNVGANTQWGKVFTQFLTGLAAGYIGQQGCVSKFNTACSCGGTVCLSKSFNWCPNYAFGKNQTPSFAPASTQVSDPIAKYFFNNTNVYGDMYQDNIMSKYTKGGPLLALTNACGRQNICLTVYGPCEIGSCYTTPVSNATYSGSMASLTCTNLSKQKLTFNFANLTTTCGASNMAPDPSKFSLKMRGYCSTSGWTGWACVAGGSAESVTATFNSYACPNNVPGAKNNYLCFIGNCANKSKYTLTSSAKSFQGSCSTNAQCQYTYKNVPLKQCGANSAAPGTKFTIQPYQAPSCQKVVYSGCTTSEVGINNGYGFNIYQHLHYNVCDVYGATKVCVNASTVKLCMSVQGAGCKVLYGLNCSTYKGAAVVFKDGYGTTFSVKNPVKFSPGCHPLGIQTVQFQACNVTACALTAYNNLENKKAECISAKLLSGCFNTKTNLAAYISPYYVSASVCPNPSIWNNYAVNYCATGKNYTVTPGPKSGLVGNLNLCLPSSCVNPILYQFQVTNKSNCVSKTYNVYARNCGSNFVDGGALAVGAISGNNICYKNQSLNFFTGGCLSYQPCLVAPTNQGGGKGFYVNGNQASAPIIGTPTLTNYQFLGKCAPITALQGQTVNTCTSKATANTTCNYVFGCAGYNSAQLTSSSCVYNNKVMPLNIVAIKICQSGTAVYRFAQADIDGMWLTGKDVMLGGGKQLCGCPYNFSAAGNYKITFTEYFAACAANLAAGNWYCVKPVGQPSHSLCLCVSGIGSSRR